MRGPESEEEVDGACDPESGGGGGLLVYFFFLLCFEGTLSSRVLFV